MPSRREISENVYRFEGKTSVGEIALSHDFGDRVERNCYLIDQRDHQKATSEALCHRGSNRRKWRSQINLEVASHVR